LVACIVACSLAAGCYKCSQCRLRDCSCLKWWLRTTGTDRFEDLELFIVVHECYYASTEGEMMTMVRVSAGEHSATTEVHKRVFQQPMSIFVEQGTEKLEVDLMDSWGRARWAKLDLDIAELLNVDGGWREHVFSMKPCKRGLANPRVKLTVFRSRNTDEEEGILSKIQVTEDHAGLMVKEHLQKVHQAEIAARGSVEMAGEDFAPMMSEGHLLASACAGELELLGAWGAKDKRWVMVKSGPSVKRAFLGVWEDRRACDNGKAPMHEIDFLRIKSVQAHPVQDAAFMINLVKRDGSTRQFTFYRIDRSRDVWVQTLTLLIQKERDRKKAGEAKKKPRISGPLH